MGINRIENAPIKAKLEEGMGRNCKPILLTGAHRSGTTWVGKMIASSPEVVYIHEPFNPHQKKGGIYHISFDNWFTYLTDENGNNYEIPIQKMLSLQYHIEEKRYKNFIDQLKNYKRYFYYKAKHYSNRRILLKDPIAIFSAEWLAKHFDMQVIVLIRHPAAFVASLRQANWGYPFQHFLNQPLLMKRYLEPFESEIRDFANDSKDIIDQGCLLWRIIYSIVNHYRSENQEWIYIRHEDISRNPVSEFRKLFSMIGLPFTSSVKESILDSSQASDLSVGPLKRNSQKNILSWHQRLTLNEISYVYHKVNDISQYFYTDEEWNQNVEMIDSPESDI